MSSSRPSIQTICHHCSAVFLASTANIAKGYGRFCSRFCANAGRTMSPNSLENLKARQAKSENPGAAKILYRQKNREKHLAHVAVATAIRRKKLVRLPCQLCGDIKSHAHHEDYSKKLDVIWLCAKHHFEHHCNQKSEVDSQNPLDLPTP